MYTYLPEFLFQSVVAMDDEQETKNSSGLRTPADKKRNKHSDTLQA